MERWFGVIVLGGAALSSCTDEGEEMGGAGGEDSGATTVGSGGETGDGGTANEGGSAAVTGTGGGTTGGGMGGGMGGGLVCSLEPDPGDACGCPCCWATDCANDEPCCEAFCAAGEDGAGCCGL